MKVAKTWEKFSNLFLGTFDSKEFVRVKYISEFRDAEREELSSKQKATFFVDEKLEKIRYPVAEHWMFSKCERMRLVSYLWHPSSLHFYIWSFIIAVEVDTFLIFQFHYQFQPSITSRK